MGDEKLQQVVGELQNVDNETNVKLQQVGAGLQEQIESTGDELAFPLLFSFVPWGHHILIITKCKDIDEALFYIRQTINEGWSRNTLFLMNNRKNSTLFLTNNRQIPTLFLTNN